MTTLKLTEAGDTQLWVVHGKDWSLPVYVHPYSNKKDIYYRVWPAMALNHYQWEALDSKLAQLSIAPYESAWCILEPDFHPAAEKAPRLTPARYFKWKGGVIPDQKTEVVVERGKARNEPMNDAFLKYVNGRYHLTDRLPQLRYIWFVLCTEMAAWMYKKQKPIDLGFAKLDAFPFRSNWKQILLSKFPWFMGLVRKFSKKPAFMANLALTEFPIELRRSDLAAMSKKGGKEIKWTLEVTPSESWDEFVKDQEIGIMQKGGESSYVSYYRKRVDNSEERAIDVFRSFVEATAQPCATVRVSGNTGIKRLVPFVPQGKVRPASMDVGAESVVTESPDLANKGRSDESAVFVDAENEVLPEMSVIRFEPKELRNAGELSRN